MKSTKILIQGTLVWLTQLLLSDLLAISTVRPDFCLILIIYWSFQYNRSIAIISGFLIGLIIDLSGVALFFGLSPLTYALTCYLCGGLNESRLQYNLFYFTFYWISIIFLHFFIYCLVYYQELWDLDIKLFIINWFGTVLYTLSFMGILQIIFPLSRVYGAKSR